MLCACGAAACARGVRDGLADFGQSSMIITVNEAIDLEFIKQQIDQLEVTRWGASSISSCRCRR